jgi:cyclophilin family peptidyl-prolyl cis-trans isomerase
MMSKYAWLAAVVLLGGCSPAPQTAREEAKQAPPESAPKDAPDTPPPAAPEAKPEPKKAAGSTFKVRFDTTKGPVVVEVHPDWAPRGAERFRELVEDRYYDNAAFFRVVPNFVVQFGIAAEPAKTAKWNKQFKDDPVLRTNRAGTLVYATAGPNTRTTQLFINLRGNQNLDDQGFAPFAEVVEGMDVVQKISSVHGEDPDQQMIERRGNAYLKANFPNLDYIKTARIVE